MAVVDHGPGVREADWDRMFVPFQRLDDRGTDTGVGLGLAIARGFTEAMGGTLQPGDTARRRAHDDVHPAASRRESSPGRT